MTETPPNSDAEPAKPDPPAEEGNLPALNREIIHRLQPFVEPGREQDAARAVHSLIIRESHSGPLPPAREFARYEQVLPGVANRILAMAENEQSHRQNLEGIVVDREGNMRSRGQLLALLALSLMLAVVAYLAYLGHAKEAAALGGVVIVGVVALFLGERGYFKARPNPPADDEE